MLVAQRRRLPLLVALVFLVTACFSGVAVGQSTPEATPEAQTGPSFVLRPSEDVDGSYFSVEAEAGSSQTLQVVVGNADDVELTLRTYAADVFTLVNDGFGVYEETDSRTGPGSWISYEATTVTLESGQGLEREIGLSIPAGTAPGQYIAGIVLETAEPITVEGSSIFKQIISKSIAVFITVPGPTNPAMELGLPTVRINPTGAQLVIPVTNTGNVLVKPAGELALSVTDGTEIFRQELQMGSVYAGMATTLEVPLPTTVPDGGYSLSLVLTDDATQAAASIDGTALTISRAEVDLPPVSLVTATLIPMPTDDEVQFASIAISIENTDVPIAGARLILNVENDGVPVEDFVLATAVTLQQGTTDLEQRYLPVTGWTPGEWRFSLTLETVDPLTGASTTVFSTDLDEPIIVRGE